MCRAEKIKEVAKRIRDSHGDGEEEVYKLYDEFAVLQHEHYLETGELVNVLTS